jgi:hypothetical protein
MPRDVMIQDQEMIGKHIRCMDVKSFHDGRYKILGYISRDLMGGEGDAFSFHQDQTKFRSLEEVDEMLASLASLRSVWWAEEKRLKQRARKLKEREADESAAY